MKQGSIVMAMIWMAVLSLLLFWLPLLGPLIAGFVGGRTAGSAGGGLLAAVLPAAVLCFVLVGFGTALAGLPLIGIIASAGLFILIVVQSLPLLLGAFVGGLTV
ncbi:hypothetical protein T35B1_07020 [Salinisphaera shabanensis T35B1]|jgi:hypothetical protein|uniref:Uncharacterized protein n=1 Tax=Salinisphaera shabanensis E1L3A TaxID=1033802 RepID=U2FRD9_9GAMM|nr:hypothetical protein [Salinisphaera shabanensis]ERJ18644.1 hypothetical protein SSPSH_002342 [Salinisphaera shabanensis E1L3A]